MRSKFHLVEEEDKSEGIVDHQNRWKNQKLNNDQNVIQYTATLHDFEKVKKNIQNIQAINFKKTERKAMVTVKLANQASFEHDLVSLNEDHSSQHKSESIHWSGSPCLTNIVEPQQLQIMNDENHSHASLDHNEEGSHE